MPTEDKLWLPPLSPKDQKKLDQLQKNGRRSLSKWTGFSGKTMWDWLQLLGVLAIPVVIALISISFSLQQDASNQQQHRIDLKIAQDNRQNDIQLANDQQQEATLKSYLDDISDLLLNHNLRNSKPADEVRQVARERTLTALRRLGAMRNQIVLQFLQDARLMGVKSAVIDLSGSTLSGDDLSLVNLSGAELSRAILYNTNLSAAFLGSAELSRAYLGNANLSSAILENANLSGANLYNANLSYTDLNRTNLHGADLDNANLSGAILYYADLSGASLYNADLSGANLSGAIVTNEQLAQTKSLQSATMPDGSLHP
jgi:uncharacterized protein YjbI with pentapeptide repeats